MSIWKTEWGYRAEFMINGQRISAKGFFRYKDEARQWINQEKARLKNQPQKSSSNADSLKSLWDLSQTYLADCKINFSKKTFDEKLNCIKRFYDKVSDIPFTDINPALVLEFINERAKTVSNNAANKDRKNLKAFFRWVQDMYGIMHDPTAPIRKKSHSKKARRLIPIQDILKVILMAQGHDRVLVASYWHTGGRKSEILRWTWADDINFEERWIRLGSKKNKSGEMRYAKLWMNDDLFKQLKWQWANRHPSSPYVFCHMNPKSKYYGKPYDERRKLLKKLCSGAGVEPFEYHDIRHTVAKYLNDLQKIGLKKVQQVLRHQRQSTTEIYVEGNYTGTEEVMTLLELNNVKNFV